MSGEMAALHAIVRGRVQGVGFRDFVVTQARFLGLTGYVRNLPDGRSVEVVAEGLRSGVEGLLEHIREGPGGSLVNGVGVTWGSLVGASRASG